MAVDITGTGSRRPDVSSKIGGTDNRGTGAVGAGRAVGRVLDVTGQPKAAEQQPDANDVHITGTARQLVELEQVVKDMPAVDEAKVAAISAAIENGTYKVSADKVADNLMQIEQALAPLNGK
jgi:negative regulator of flagellin synthesis FlgM